MRYINCKMIVISFVSLILMTAATQASDSLYVWYGNLDGSPLEADTSALLEVEVYTQTTSGAYVASLLLNLGADNDYFDSLLSDQFGEVYYPLTEWDMAVFFPADQSPPNPSGWKSQAMFGLAELAPPFNSYWLHFDQPTLTIKYVFKTSSNTDIIGQTAACLGPGLNTPQGPSNAGDTAGNANYMVVEYFSPVHFNGPTGLEEALLELPDQTEISQNYPNPFNATTNIEYSLAEPTQVELTVYDIQGRVVNKLVDSYQQAGFYRVNWNGDHLPSGVYFYKLNAGDLSEVKQMVLLK